MTYKRYNSLDDEHNKILNFKKKEHKSVMFRVWEYNNTDTEKMLKYMKDNFNMEIEINRTIGEKPCILWYDPIFDNSRDYRSAFYQYFIEGFMQALKIHS